MNDEQYIKKMESVYMQFPEDVSVEKQAEYVTKVKESLEKDNIVVIDPKIKIIPAARYEKKAEPVPATPAATAPPTPEPAPAPVSTTVSGTTITKVEATPAPAAPAAEHPFIGNTNDSSQPNGQ